MYSNSEHSRFKSKSSEDKLKEKLNNLKDNNSGGSNSSAKHLFKPTEEQKTIRIVPYAWCKDNPFQELWLYYNIKKGAALVSPKTIGEADKDPIIAYSKKIMSRMQGDTEAWKKAVEFMPKIRIFVPVIVRGEESEGIKFWGFGKDIYKKLLEIFVDPEYNEQGDLTDLEFGRDITVWTEAIPGKTFSTPNFKVKLRHSKLLEVDDAKTLKKILVEQPKLLGEVFNISTTDELAEALDNYINPEKESEQLYEPKSTKTSDTPSPTKKTQPVVDEEDEESVEDILKDFDDM